MMGLFIDEIFALTTCQTNCLAGEINGTTRYFAEKQNNKAMQDFFNVHIRVTSLIFISFIRELLFF